MYKQIQEKNAKGKIEKHGEKSRRLKIREENNTKSKEKKSEKESK